MTELSVTLPPLARRPVLDGGSRVTPSSPSYELTWTSTSVSTNAGTGYAGWPNVTYSGWVQGRYYSGGDPSFIESTRSTCNLTRNGVVVGRALSIEKGSMYNGPECIVTTASDEDPTHVNVKVYDLGGNYDLFQNVQFDSVWTVGGDEVFDHVYLLTSLGGGNPDLGTYNFGGAVDTSYNGSVYHIGGLAITAGSGEINRAYLACFLFSGYTVLRSSIHGITSTDAPMNNQWPDLWSTTTAPDVNRTVHDLYSEPILWGNWILLTCPDGVSQICIIRMSPTYIQHMYIYWSPGGLFTGGAGEARPTATDEVITEGGDGDYLSTINTFYGFKGVRGNGETTSRVLVTYQPTTGHETIIRMFNFEWFVTDIPAATYPRNVCFIEAYGGYYHTQLTKVNSRAKIIMPDGKLAGFCVSGIQTTQYWGSQNTADNNGSLDGKYRLEPIYVSTNYPSPTHQFFGYIPDMYWGDAVELNSANHTYTFDTIWKKFTHLVLPTFDTVYTTNVSDHPAYLVAARPPGKAAADAGAPTFAGITSAVALDDYTVQVTWESGSDGVTADEDLAYELHYSTSPSAEFTLRAVVSGA